LCNVMDIKHLFIRGNYRTEIFFDKIDMINAWNRIWLSAHKTGVVILAVNILTNHLHLCAGKDTNTANPDSLNTNDSWISEFMHHLRMSLSLYFNHRYKVHGSLGGRRYGRANVIDPQEDGGDDLRDLIKYILRNVTHHCISDDYQSWQFSTFKYAYNLTDEQEILTGEEIPEALKRAYLPSSCEFPKNWSMTKEGFIIPPESIFPKKVVEMLFSNVSNYLKFCEIPSRREGKGEINERPLCNHNSPNDRLSDHEIIKKVEVKYPIPIVSMSREQKLTAIKSIYTECPTASLRQLARIFAIPFSTIRFWLHTPRPPKLCNNG